MAKRGYKLQEFVAHSGSVNCLSIGKKTCRLFITGGDDQRVNLWSIGKPTSLMSLCGHASSVESLAFDSSEILVVAGASSGVIKLWDLEETKIVRTLTGHRSSCTTVEFHPFGEFFASGSMDTNLKIWDIRKKGCIHTYKGHTQGISNIRFSPDGRWVVSGGFDNVVKVWDLTAGKLLHDFKFHEGHVRAIDFHPLEFLMATGSSDRTVKFWDLETFELIGSSRPEATGVRSITFHPDGRTLLCGFDNSLKVYSWEPVICHDAFDIGWSTLGDLVIYDGKVLGCSYYRNSIGVWVADISLIEPHGAGLVSEQNSSLADKYDLHGSPLEKIGSHRRSSSSLRSISPDNDSKVIKNIYIDTAGVNSTTSKKGASLNPSKGTSPSNPKDLSGLATLKPTAAPQAKIIRQANAKSFTVPAIVPRESIDGRESNSRREPTTSSRVGSCMSLETQHIRKSLASKLDMERMIIPAEVGAVKTIPKSGTTEDVRDLSFDSEFVVNDDSRESLEERHSDIKSVTEKFEKVLSPLTPSNQENRDKPLDSNKESDSVKVVNVIVKRGRTRSLVERFEKREGLNYDGVQIPEKASSLTPERASSLTPERASSLTPKVAKAPIMNNHPQISGGEAMVANDDNVLEDVMQTHDVLLSTLRSRLTKLQVVRHFWDRYDIKGAINAIKKLPDHSVQADILSVLIEKKDILTLDMFPSLLPVLLGLLDSKVERHAIVSLEMLLKLVAVFVPVIRSTISAPRGVGVNLHAEQRLECCNECFIQLQKVQVLLPSLVRRGGVLARRAQELNLFLQDS